MTSLSQLKKERLIFGIYLLALIVAIELALHYFHLPTWPVFLVMIFFFEAHMDKARAPHLVVGGLVGITFYILTVQFVELTGPTLGISTARLIFICLAVYSIVAFGEIWPIIFNNYAFMFFLVSGLAAQIQGVTPAPFIWLAVTLIGGPLVILCIIGIGMIMARTGQIATPASDHRQ